MPTLQWQRERDNTPGLEFMCEAEINGVPCPNRAEWRLGDPSQGVTWACSAGGLPAYTNGKFNPNSHRYIAAFQWMKAAIQRSQERQKQKQAVRNRSIFGSLPLYPGDGESDSDH